MSHAAPWPNRRTWLGSFGFRTPTMAWPPSEVSGRRAVVRGRAVVARGSVRNSIQGQARGPRRIAAVLMMAPLETGEGTRRRGGGGSC